MSKQREAILRLYSIYFSLLKKQDYASACLVYNLIAIIALEGSRRLYKAF